MPATVWRGRLAFGLVSIPIRLYRAARRERVRFHHIYRPSAIPEPEPEPVGEAETEPEPVRIHMVPKAEERPREPEVEPVERVHIDRVVPPQQILKGFEYEKERYVALEEHEIKALKPKTSDELEIVQFVKLEEIDPIYFDASYYAAPDKGGEKPYAMLHDALRASGYAALGTFAMHGREHASVIRTGPRGLLLHTLFYANEIHAADEYAAPQDQVSAKELELAQMLIRALAAPFDASRFKDTFEERVRELIEARAAAGLAPTTAAAKTGEAPRGAPVIDIMEALKKSLEMARKPAAREESAKASPKKRTRKA